MFPRALCISKRRGGFEPGVRGPTHADRNRRGGGTVGPLRYRAYSSGLQGTEYKRVVTAREGVFHAVVLSVESSCAHIKSCLDTNFEKFGKAQEDPEAHFQTHAGLLVERI